MNELALAGDVAVDGEEVVATVVRRPRGSRWRPRRSATLRHASADDCGEAGRALWGNR